MALSTRQSISFSAVVFAAFLAAFLFDVAGVSAISGDMAIRTAAAAPLRTIRDSSAQPATQADDYQRWLADAHAGAARTGEVPLVVDGF